MVRTRHIQVRDASKHLRQTVHLKAPCHAKHSRAFASSRGTAKHSDHKDH